jgi:FtsZ-interacting cell division protein ZipA
MKTETVILILIAVGILAVVVLGILTSTRRSRSRKLREKYGPEYDLTMEKVGGRRKTEEELKEREKRVNKLDIRALDEHERERYHEEWIKIQTEFVDNPSKSVEQANRLIMEVMIARGFPVADIEQRAADLSVMYPNFVPNYRNAYAIALKNQHNEASTEELRQAMVYYHSLFEELLGKSETKENEAATK